jgi:hypothetical protein
VPPPIDTAIDVFSPIDVLMPDAFTPPDAFVLPDAYDVRGDLVAWYPFGSDPLSDASGNGHTLMNTGVTFGGRLGTFSTGDILITPDAADLDQVVALTAWIRPSSIPTAGNRMGVVDRDGSFGLFLYDRGRPSCSLTGDRLFAPDGAAMAGVWTHVACVRDATAMTVRLYVNGVERATTEAAGIADGASRLQVGQNCCDNADAFTGDLSDIRLYRRAITAAEVAILAATPP